MQDGPGVHTLQAAQRLQGHISSTAPTIWIAQSAADAAREILDLLHSVDVDVRLWNESDVGPLAKPIRGLVLAEMSRFQSAARTAFDFSDKAPARRVCRGGLAPGALRRVLEHIDKFYSERNDLASLANLAGLSECHFARAFRQSVGVPPHRYVVKRRIAVATDLVERTERSFTDIALTVGFSDHSHFTRSFVQLKGETPRECRRRHR
jgi:AraC-like DNA-binding protein